MRLPAFLFALCLVAVLAIGATVSSQQPTNAPQLTAWPAQSASNNISDYNGSRMMRRAEIHVIPLEQADRNKAELQSLQARVAQAEGQSTGFWFSDPEVRKQLLVQAQLMRDLLKFAEQQQSNKGKSPTALAVERRLNQMQGQRMCEACHSGIVASNAGVRRGK